MPFCMNCGTRLQETDAFCFRCGTPTRSSVPITPPAYSGPDLHCDLAEGKETVFPFYDTAVVVSPQMDAFNYYRKHFSRLAKRKAAELRAEYCARITNLDTFLTVFPQIYARHRKPLIDAAMEVFAQAELYDISPEQFEEQHTADFCLCGEDVDTIIESFNLTIEANQNRKAQMYNMMPGMVFHGIGGFVTALAVNAAVNTIAENDIKNANVTGTQRAEIFGRIHLDTLMERAYIDYWRVFLSLTYILNQRGLGVWYPTVENNNRANGLYQNLTAGRIPPNKIVSQAAMLLSLNPYADGYLDYFKIRFGTNAQTQAIIDYFSV